MAYTPPAKGSVDFALTAFTPPAKGAVDFALDSAAASGQIKVWLGSWVAKPIKVWTGAAWITKPLKKWTGAVWVATPY